MQNETFPISEGRQVKAYYTALASSTLSCEIHYISFYVCKALSGQGPGYLRNSLTPSISLHLLLAESCWLSEGESA